MGTLVRALFTSTLHLATSALILLTALVGSGWAQARGSNVRSAPGTPAGTYALDNLESINYFNGRVHFGLPLLKVGGRGGVQQTVKLTIDPQWPTQGKGCPGCSGYLPLWVGRHDYEAGYGPGVLEAMVEGNMPQNVDCGNTLVGVYANDKARTTLRFKTSEGTEYTLVDTIYEGQVKDVGDSCGNSSLKATLRGKVFVTKDGSGLTFISDADIYDNRYNYGGDSRYFPSGVLKFRDGTRYRIDNGTVTWASDRNGNLITYQYYPSASPYPGLVPPEVFPGKVKEIKDQLGRKVEFTYGIPTSVPTERYDEISYRGFNDQPRTVRVYYARLEHALRESATLQSYCQLGVDCENVTGGELANPLVVSAVTIPDGKSYHFYYDKYAELTRYELPTGGAVEYDYDWGGHASEFQSDYYRRVVQRRTYPNGGTGAAYESKTNYSKPEHVFPLPQLGPHVYGASSDGHVDVDHIGKSNGTETLLSRERHYYYGWAISALVSDNVSGAVWPPGPSLYGDTNLGYFSWKAGREYRTDYLKSDGSTSLRIVETAWQQTSTPSWWLGSPDMAPANNPRVIETVTKLTDVSPNLVARQTAIDPNNSGFVGFDQYNNRTDTWEFDFGPGGPGPLLRRTHTEYETSAAYTDQYGAHIRNLPRQQWVSSDAAGANKLSITSYGYDEFDLAGCPNIIQHDPGFTANYTTRGNQTSVIHYANASNGSGAVTATLN